MKSISEKLVQSPCRRFKARLSPSAGSSWDCSHAMLALQDLYFGSRVFGWHGIWSPCSRYFAITEWLDVDTSHCPDMQLVIIDVDAGKECFVEQVKCGFVEPMSFHDDTLKYNKIGKGMDARTVEHRRISELTGWRPVSGSRPDARDSPEDTGTV
ncbi:MAG: hypothetical protein HGB21_14245 [Nitrospirae bacterium]|nr:hypothetical protein [Nitrospirota bacterium]